MGVNHIGLKALLTAKAAGADFERTVTLGHQELHVGEAELVREFRAFHVPFEPQDIRSIVRNPFADDLFRHLGATTVEAIDASDYQRPSIVHDLNRPIPSSLAERFTAVVDGGTLEHVFNFPMASRNFLSLAAEGGHLISIAPANNLCGHGFYQFSPELFFRVFGPRNGCEIVAIFLADTVAGLPWHRVTDPLKLHRRIVLYSMRATLMVMLARRRSTVIDEAFCPQQSDYAEGEWKNEAHVESSSAPRSILWRMAKALPPLATRPLLDLRNLLLRTGYRDDGYETVYPERMTFDALPPLRSGRDQSGP